jgi:hypothetical protein
VDPLGILPVELYLVHKYLHFYNLLASGTTTGQELLRSALDTLREIIWKYENTHTITVAGDYNEYKKNVKVELEDFRYLKMKTPYGVEQSITHFINSIQKATNLCCPQNQAKFRRRKEYSWTLIIRSCRQIKKNILPMEKGRIILLM